MSKNSKDKTTLDKPSQRQPVSLEEALQTEMLINQALIDILVAKGVITQDELIARIREIREGK